MPRVVEETILPLKDFDIEYENVEVQHDKLKQKLTNVQINFKKQGLREIGGGFGGYITNRKNQLVSSVNSDLANKTVLNRKKSLALAVIDS